MNNARIGITFLVVLLIVLLAMFQMQLRGYQEIERINAYVLYETSVDTCQDQLYTSDDLEYRIVCENKYLLKSGLSEYSIVDALEEELIVMDDIEPFITIE